MKKIIEAIFLIIIFLGLVGFVNACFAGTKTNNINVSAILKYNYDIKVYNNEVKTSSNNAYKNYRVIVSDNYITIEY